VKGSVKSATGRLPSIELRKVNFEEVICDGAKEPLYLAPNDILFMPRSSTAATLWVRQHIVDLIPIFRGIGASVPLGF
jgi:hypothetical protein